MITHILKINLQCIFSTSVVSNLYFLSYTAKVSSFHYLQCLVNFVYFIKYLFLLLFWQFFDYAMGNQQITEASPSVFVS